MQSANRSISINILGIPTGVDLDVFALSPQNPEFGGYSVREVLWNGTNFRTVSMPSLDGLWEIGISPWTPKDPSSISTFTLKQFEEHDT